ncbi:MAG: hypothetical protein M8841_03540 [marine benthic group bacterium]|nr:hypothetical protein [Gemmatimonadota bacterium]MCL7937651.1 hypothetical protein [Gemmatimonadota bacterium]
MRPSICARCLLPDGWARVKLTKEGTCNYCRQWEAAGPELLDPGRYAPLLRDRIERTRGRFAYDAAVGLSGGKDGAYVLHRLRHDFGANVLAVTFDHGFLSEHARRNVKSLCRSGHWDHVVYRPDWGRLRNAYREALRRFADPCLACSLFGYSLAVRGCQDLRIPCFVHGRSPFQMFRSFCPGSSDPTLALVRSNLQAPAERRLRRTYRRITRNLRRLLRALLPDPRDRRRAMQELFLDVSPHAEVVPEFLAYFLYAEYDELAIVRELEGSGTGYRRPPGYRIMGHGDCLIHAAAEHFHERRHGVSRTATDVAVMLRMNVVDRAEAERIIDANRPSEEEVDISIACLVERLEIDRSEIEALTQDTHRYAAPVPLS